MKACTICDTPTDTYVGFNGSFQWLVTPLVAFGLSREVAEVLVQYSLNEQKLTPPCTLIYCVCPTCADKLPNLTLTKADADTLKLYRQPNQVGDPVDGQHRLRGWN